MKNTKIQRCHSTINPVMGCDGCELWKPATTIATIMLAMLLLLTKKPKGIVKPAVSRAVGDRETSELYRDREQVAEELAVGLSLTREQQKQVVDVIREECECYAGLLGVMRAGHAGYADRLVILLSASDCRPHSPVHEIDFSVFSALQQHPHGSRPRTPTEDPSGCSLPRIECETYFFAGA